MANYSELLNDINAAIYENNDQEIDALEVRAILREMVTSLGSGFLFKGIATPSSPGTSQAPDQNVFYLATTAGTYTYLGGLVVAAGEVAFLCYDGTWTKKSSALLSTGSIVDNTTTEDATKPLSAKQGKVLADAGAATAAEVTALGQEVDDLDTKINGANVSYDNSILTVGAYINSNTGEEVSNDYRSRTGFIEIVPGATIQFTVFGSLAGQGYALYDSSKTYVSGQDYTDGAVHTITMVVPANIHYIRISFVSSANPNFSSFSFVENLSGMEYDVATLIEEVAQIGEESDNKIDKDILLDKSINIFDGETLVGWMLNGALDATKTTWRTTTNPIPVEYGKTYYCTGKKSTGDRVGVGRYLTEFDIDGNVISHTPYIDTDNYTPTSASVKSIKWSWQPTENGYSDPSVDMEIMVFEFGVESKMVTPR